MTHEHITESVRPVHVPQARRCVPQQPKKLREIRGRSCGQQATPWSDVARLDDVVKPK